MDLLPLDNCDLRILDAVQRDAGLSHKQLGERCHVSEATCSRRIARLKKRGIIGQQMVRLDARKLGLKLTIFVLVTVEHEHEAELANFVERLRKLDAVQGISLISGEHDYLLQVVSADMEQYNQFAERYLVQDRRIKRYLSLFEMKSHKQTAALPLKHD